jgi:hypothetical protein
LLTLTLIGNFKFFDRFVQQKKVCTFEILKTLEERTKTKQTERERETATCGVKVSLGHLSSNGGGKTRSI